MFLFRWFEEWLFMRRQLRAASLQFEIARRLPLPEFRSKGE